MAGRNLNHFVLVLWGQHTLNYAGDRKNWVLIASINTGSPNVVLRAQDQCTSLKVSWVTLRPVKQSQQETSIDWWTVWGHFPLSTLLQQDAKEVVV